ncbi:hypothetical protein M433DRAFT_154594 [Acidomyces richmondensis BFW]|nr:MAG: hypothetical protein FE78DRAFT_90737 [Acidomyces sp. 'richmondensis']KYG45371.1 hypothetical protein M433DRAFT_154594 [Acidomyces richmondensis BFW]
MHSSTDQDYCTKSHIGYDPANVMARIDYSLHPSSTSFSEIAAGTSDSLTRVMILHPIACGLAFIAFLLSLGAGVVGSLAGFFVGFIAWILTVIVLATDFTVFGIVRHHVNNDGSGSHAYFGIAIWLLVAAFVVLFFGMFIVLFTCCSARRERKRSAVSKHEADGPTGQRRKRFGLF